MNRLTGVIKEIKSVEGITQVFVEVEDKILSVLILSGDEEYKEGERVNLLFKETEVMIATPESQVSARNSFVSRITSISIGEILAEVAFDFYGKKITSIITRGALNELKCQVDDEFRWLVKSNEVSIQKG
ncbi:MAG: TOBE domain-containing protein [Campylobacterales bacterium]|nr:TOBE domain-containing protein [Campylobacterales bacterium]